MERNRGGGKGCVERESEGGGLWRERGKVFGEREGGMEAVCGKKEEIDSV